MQTDPEQFDCGTCRVATEIEALDTPNTAAWGIYHRCATRFCVDARLIGRRLEAETAGWAPDEVCDLFDRLGILYDVLQPPKKKDA